MDPYAYVGGNPETRVDPTGRWFIDRQGDIGWNTPTGANNSGVIFVLTTITDHGSWITVTPFSEPSAHDSNGTAVTDTSYGGSTHWSPSGSCTLCALGAAGAIVLNPPDDALCVAAFAVCVGVGIVAIVVLGILLIINHNQVTLAPTSSTSTTATAYSWINKPTEDGTTVKVRKLTNDEVSDLEEFGQSFEEIKSEEGYPPNSDIYIDKNGDYWIQPPRGKVLIPFPS
jgi:hypothetical protein